MSQRLITALIAAVLATSLGLAMPDPPGPATVHVARAEKILVAPGISAPRLLYPQGRVDYDVVYRLVSNVMTGLTGLDGTNAWRALFKGSDRVGIMVDGTRYPVQLATVETVIDHLVDAGINPASIVVFGGDEGDLFSAGFTINRDPKSVRVLGTESEGYRGGVSRIVSDYCDTLISIAPLKTDSDLGFAGCVANALSCVPRAQRLALRQTPLKVASVAALPVVRQRLRLCLLEAYVPVLEAGAPGQPPVTAQYGALLAGTDPVAVDTIGRQILDGCRQAAGLPAGAHTPETDYLRAAQEQYRLGQADRAQITVRFQGHRQDSHLE